MAEEKVFTYEDAEAVLERFDFEKVRAFMILNKWYYRDAKTAPSIEELERTARYALYTVIDDRDHPSTNAGSGGFTAYKLPWGLSLHFNLEISKTY